MFRSGSELLGFLSGRRYRASERSENQYFTLYELESLAALGGPDYAEVVDHPTTWSTAMRPSFRNFLRSPCEMLLTSGVGIGGALATMRFTVPKDGATRPTADRLYPRDRSVHCSM